MRHWYTITIVNKLAKEKFEFPFFGTLGQAKCLVAELVNVVDRQRTRIGYSEDSVTEALKRVIVLAILASLGAMEKFLPPSLITY